jgi:hypothetical protein
MLGKQGRTILLKTVLHFLQTRALTVANDSSPKQQKQLKTQRTKMRENFCRKNLTQTVILFNDSALGFRESI